jgi:hypothetical protein
MKILIWGLMICCVSCTHISESAFISADIVQYDSFAIEIAKTAHPTTMIAMGAYSLAIYEKLLVAITVNSDSIVSVIDLETGKSLLKCCRNGRGPDDYLRFYTQKQFVIRNGHICLWTSDLDVKERLLDITESVKKQEAVFEESWVYNRELLQNDGILQLPSGERFAKFPITYEDARDNIFFPPKYIYFSPDKKEIKKLKFFSGDRFSLSKSGSMALKALMFNGTLRIKPDGTKAVDAFRYTEHINFIDLVKSVGFSMSYTRKGLSIDDAASASITNLQEKYVEVYNDVAVTDEYVLALYSGKPEALDGTTVPNTKSAIRIFDWEGKPIALINVDRELASIAYDQRTKKVYALDFEEKIVYYKLDDVI